MELIFKTTAELKQYATGFSENSLYFEDYKPDADVVQDFYLKKILGQETLTQLWEDYDAETLEGDMLLLWQKCMPVVANLTLYYFMPSQYSILSSGGDRTTSTEQAERSPLWAFRQKREQYLMKGMQAIDALYLFLEENKDVFEDWATSTAYTEYKQYFVNSTAVFHQYCRIANSRNTYLAMVPHIERFEEITLRPTLGTDFFDELKEKFIDDDLSADEKTLVGYLQNAIACLAMARAANELTFKFVQDGIISLALLNNTDDQKENEVADSRLVRYIEQCTADGQAMLQRAIDELNLKASETVFATWFASDKYVSLEERKTVRTPDFGNSGKRGSFFFGGK